MNFVQPIRKLEDIEKFKLELRKKRIRDWMLFTLGINSGLRISDLLALNVGDVKNKNFLEVWEKKTKKYKKIFINENLRKEIKKFVKDRDELEPLFLSQKGFRMERNQVYRILNQTAKKNGLLVRMGTHSLRKTFGYHHYKRFNDLALLQKIFNHSSSEITLRYIGLEQDAIDKSYSKFYL